MECEQKKAWALCSSIHLLRKQTYHGFFNILLIVVASCGIVITVNNLNSDVTLGETRAPFTCRSWKELHCLDHLCIKLTIKSLFKCKEDCIRKVGRFPFLLILTIELTFACVPAAQRDHRDDTDEQDAASTDCSTDNYQCGQGLWQHKTEREGCQGIKWHLVWLKSMSKKKKYQDERWKRKEILSFVLMFLVKQQFLYRKL